MTPRSTFSRLKNRYIRAIFFTTKLVLATILILWILAIPQGNLDYNLDLENQIADTETKNLARELFSSSTSKIKYVSNLYKTVSFLPKTAEFPLKKFKLYFPPAFNLNRIVKKLILKTGTVSNSDKSHDWFIVEIDIRKFWQATYSFFNWRDHLVTFTQIRKTSDSCKNGDYCLKVDVKMPPHYSDTFKGNMQDVSLDLAHFILRTTLDMQEKKANPEYTKLKHTPFISSTELPEKYPELQTLSNTIEIIDGRDNCTQTSTETCVKRALSLLKEFDSDPFCETNPGDKKYADDATKNFSNLSSVAAYVFAKIYFHKVFLESKNMYTSYKLECYFNKGRKLLQYATAAFSSPKYILLKHLKFKNDLPKFNQLQELHRNLGPGNHILQQDFNKLMADFACMLQARRHGNWNNCMLYADKLSNIPRGFLSIVLAAKAESEINLHRMRREDDQAFVALQKWLTHFFDEKLQYNRLHLGMAILNTGCEINKLNRAIDVSKLLSETLSLVSKASGKNRKLARQRVLVQVAFCKNAHIDRELQGQIKNLVGKISEDPNPTSDIHKLELRRYLAMRYLSMGRGYFERAASLLTSASSLPWTQNRLINSPYFRRFSGTPPYHRYENERADTIEMDYPTICYDVEYL